MGGTTTTATTRPTWSTEHPRVGGGDPERGTFLHPDTGAPPRGRDDMITAGTITNGLGAPLRGRGRQPDRRRHPPDRGSTPAWAGTTTSRGTSKSSSEHPPRGRGRHGAVRRDDEPVGSTPAWAGEHPRVGGDDCGGGHPAAGGYGAPPRGRGRRHVLPRRGHGVWSTPAWAGTTSSSMGSRSSSSEHPRVGGDDHA